MEGAIAENPEERAICYLHQSKEQSPAELCMWKTVIKILTESTVGLIRLRGKKMQNSDHEFNSCQQTWERHTNYIAVVMTPSSMRNHRNLKQEPCSKLVMQ